MSPIERSGGGGGTGGGAFTQIFHSQLTVDAATIDTGANAIPATFTNLLVVGKMRTDEALVLTTSDFTVNGDVGANYDRFGIFWNGSNVTTGAAFGATNLATDCVGNSADANRFTSYQITWVDYADTTAFKQACVFQQEIGTTAVLQVRVHPGEAWTWRSTAAINRLAMQPFAGGAKFKAGTSMTIYGMQ